MKINSLIYKETGGYFLNNPRIKEIRKYNLSGFIESKTFYIVKDINGDFIEPIEVASTDFEYNFNKGTKETTSFFENEKKEVSFITEVENIWAIEEKAILLKNVREQQLLTMLSKVESTPFENDVLQIINWYNVEIQQFKDFGFNYIIDVIQNESDPARLLVLEKKPIEGLDLTAKAAILERINAYFDFIIDNKN